MEYINALAIYGYIGKRVGDGVYKPPYLLVISVRFLCCNSHSYGI